MDPTLVNKHCLKVLESLSRIYEIMYGHGMFLDDLECSQMAKHCQRLGENWQCLAVTATSQGHRRWQCVPKMHYVVAHFAAQASLINPRHVQAYASESMVGRVTTIYKKSLDGPHATKHQEKVARKYGAAQLLRWTPDALI